MGRPGATLTDEQNSLVRRARVAGLHDEKGGSLDMIFQPPWLEYHMALNMLQSYFLASRFSIPLDQDQQLQRDDDAERE